MIRNRHHPRLARGAMSIALALCAGVGGVAEEAGAAPRHAPPHSPLSSRRLWATIDICSSTRHQDTLGVRGSMPGLGQPADRMFMRFRVQFQSGADHLWHYVGRGADSGFQAVGSAAFVSRQSGWTFYFHPPHRQSYTLRGVVDFQWRNAHRVILATRRGTTAGHAEATGARPRGFSAATCALR